MQQKQLTNLQTFKNRRNSTKWQPTSFKRNPFSVLWITCSRVLLDKLIFDLINTAGDEKVAILIVTIQSQNVSNYSIVIYSTSIGTWRTIFLSAESRRRDFFKKNFWIFYYFNTCILCALKIDYQNLRQKLVKIISMVFIPHKW
jgi:hypothetical protein